MQKSIAQGLAHHWMALFVIVFGLYVWLPFLAPLLMKIGWSGGGRLIQAVYSTQCHQMPDRSFFLFGPKLMYSQPEIQAVWKQTNDPAILRQYIGDPAMGWKVAWSDRMVSMYTTTWFAALLWWPLRKRIKPLPLWGLILFWLPMALDGGTHFISDFFAGMSDGFRYNNAWLAALTNHALPQWFYIGNELGSFNSWMRIITGVLFGIGLVWFAFPIVYQTVGYKTAASHLYQEAKEKLLIQSEQEKNTL